MKEKLIVSAKQIEWDSLRGIVGGYQRYCVWPYTMGKYVVDTTFPISLEEEINLTGTIYKSIDQAKQACQDHLQQYVDGLLLQLMQLTEE